MRVGNMWNHNRQMFHQYMQKMNEMNPHSVNTKMQSLAYNKKLVEKKENADNKYHSIPNMKSAMQKVRSNNLTHKLDMVNATTSKTKY